MKQDHQNQISKQGYIVGGALLIFFTMLPLVLLIGLWPNRMPEPNEPQVYAFDLFHINQVKDGIARAGTIHLNTIMFLLVALSGFPGSMIHLSTFFTKLHWLTKILNFHGGGMKPYGIVVLSTLAGLYTDKAMQKLEEVFEVVFMAYDSRPDKLTDVEIDLVKVKEGESVLG